MTINLIQCQVLFFSIKAKNSFNIRVTSGRKGAEYPVWNDFQQNEYIINMRMEV